MRADANNPYVGLRPFDVDESILFFGRNDQTLELLQRLHQRHFVAVVGSSGSGKSSLLRAGLIPSLKAGYLVEGSDGWFISIMKPGQSPLYNLAESLLMQFDPHTSATAVTAFVRKIKEEGADAILDLARPVWKEKNINFFLLIDQFEELFRFATEQQDIEKKDEAIDFVNIILELSQQKVVPFYVVITMRSDFIGDCAQFYGLPEAMNQSQYLVPRLNRVQMKTVIEGPAKLYGGKVATGLTSRLLNDLGKVKDELPLLQHALMRVWDHDKVGDLDIKDYEIVGGIENTLSNHADEAIVGMNNEDLLLTKKIFQSLTAVDEYGRKIRRPILLSELQTLTGANEEQLMKIIDLFIKEKRSFLVVNKAGDNGDKVIDISHESLIRQWKTLCIWVEEENESTANYLRLSESAELYRNKKKDFLTGAELQIALDWYNKFKPVAVWANRYKPGFAESIDYLKRSEDDWNAKLQAEKAKKRRQKILGYVMIFLLAAITISVGITAIRFKKLKRKAEAKSLLSEANAVLENDPTLALRLAEASMEKYFDSAAYRFATNIYAENSFYRILAEHNGALTSIAYSPDGKTVLTGSEDSTARLWDTDSLGKLKWKFKADDIITSVAFSPNSQMVLTGSRKTVRLWSFKGDSLQQFNDYTSDINCVGFSPDNKLIFIGSDDGIVRLWSLKGDTVQTFRGSSSAVKSVSFAPGGKFILIGSSDNIARLFNMKGKMEKELIAHTGAINSVAFSQHGQFILTGSEDGTAILWDIEKKTHKVFRGHGDGITSAIFSPSGQTICTASLDKTAKLWDTAGNPLQVFKGHTAGINSISFSPDGKNLCTASSDHTARSWIIWDDIIGQFKKHSEAVNAVAFSRDDKTIVGGTSDTTIQLWDIAKDSSRLFGEPTHAIKSIAFSPDGKKILTGSIDSIARIWNVESGTSKIFGSHGGEVNAVAFAPDGKTVCTASDRILRLWSVDGILKKECRGHSGTINTAAFSQDGKMICTGSRDHNICLWNLNGDRLAVFNGGSGSIKSVAFSPDGKTLVSGSDDDTARIYDVKGTILQKIITKNILSSVAFSPDGKTILTGSTDKYARLWDLKGNLLKEFKGHTDEINAIAFSRDGTMVCTGSSDHSIILWKVPLPLKDFLQSEAFERLSKKQKEKYEID